MQFGNWELRSDAEYWFSQDSQLYPSTNSVDEGKLHTEENVRNIYRDLVDKNFVTKYNGFSIKPGSSKDRLIVTAGEGVIQGYHFIARNSIEVPFPITNEIRQFTLGISLSYDAANHVIGDVVNKDLEIGESEVLSGVYIRWFNECEIECNYDNILILGRAWAKNGLLINDNTILDDGQKVLHAFEPDPFKDHKYDSKFVQVQVYGHATTNLDTIPSNLSEIHCDSYTYDSMHFPIELNENNRSKPASHTTDVQDCIKHLPDWYISKYGDYVTGALRFNHYSKDGLAKLHAVENSVKDSLNDKYKDGLILSPRTIGNFEKRDKHYDNEYSFGGTITSIVPNSYSNIDYNTGYTGIGATLFSQQHGETGLKLFNHNNEKIDNSGITRLVHYSTKDVIHNINIDNVNTDEINSNKFIIENIDEDLRKSSIDFKNGEIFIDSFASPVNKQFTQDIGNQGGYYFGSGIQLYTCGDETDTNYNIDFRVDEYKISIAKHNDKLHRLGNRGNKHTGEYNDDLYIEMGLGVNYDHNVSLNSNSELNLTNIIDSSSEHGNPTMYYNEDPYFKIGNLRFRSNTITGNDSITAESIKQNTIEVINDNNTLPYIRIKPRTYTEQYIAEQLIQIGTSKYDDYKLNNAQNNTFNRIVIKKENNFKDDNVTFIEHNTNNNNYRLVFNKLRPSLNLNSPSYNEINGIYSYGNIGCADTTLMSSGANNVGENDPYRNDNEWVRFTKFRYDNDKDKINGGSYVGNHEDNDGRKYGTTYNLEFNTNVANERANQIIWRYNGSTGTQNTKTLDNTPPVVLSYIHDTKTKYTNGSNSKFESWIDFNGITHYNPTDKIRDFLLLENAGLVVSGDINNPSLSGDSLNSVNNLGITISSGRVYSAVYNDFAETFEKNDVNEIATPGTLISLNPETGKYEICNGYENKFIVGVQSNSYAYLAGGNRVDSTQDIIDVENEYFTVAVSGKVWVNVVYNESNLDNIEPGDLLTSSTIIGKACKSKRGTHGTIIGKALSKPKYFTEDNQYKVLMLVMTV